MRIALTGSSSTGKTTLAKSLMQNAEFATLVGEFLTEDARSLLRSLGHTSMDKMSRTELRTFQTCYLDRKAANEEGRERFLVDRSYVDVAAYWLVRDSFDLSPVVQEQFALKCRNLAAEYDLHVYFPFGQIPFASDGYRSEDHDFHQRIALQIEALLRDWGIKFISIASPILESRVAQVLSAAMDARGSRSFDHE